MHQKQIRSLVVVWCLTGVLTVSGTPGCASHTTKTTRVVTTDQPGSAGDTPVTERTETVTTDDNRSPGIIGSAFRLVWAVVSFPFRVVGALF